jgi:hypothetical protein
MRNFQEASIEITAETSRNSTRSLPKHHINTTIDEFASEKLEPIATSSSKYRDNSRSTVHYSNTNSNTTSQSETIAKTDNLTILTINFQSITNKGTELYEIIIGTETHLDPSYNNAEILPYDIPSSYQYKPYRKELIDKNDGGVLIMIRTVIKSDECPDLDTECEIKWIDIRPNDKDQILIRSFYRPPDSDEKAIQELEKSISKIKSDKRYRNAKIFLGGDFNLGDINWATGGTIPGGRNISQSNSMINVLNNFYLEQINDLPTRSDRIFDLMITSHPTLATRTTACPPIGKSDHDILSVSTNITPRISK